MNLQQLHCTCERPVQKPLPEQSCTCSVHAKQNDHTWGFSFLYIYTWLLCDHATEVKKKTQCKSSKNNRGINDGYVFGKVKEVTQFQTPSRKDQSFAFCQTGLGLNYCHSGYSYS